MIPFFPAFCSLFYFRKWHVHQDKYNKEEGESQDGA